MKATENTGPVGLLPNTLSNAAVNLIVSFCLFANVCFFLFWLALGSVVILVGVVGFCFGFGFSVVVLVGGLVRLSTSF